MLWIYIGGILKKNIYTYIKGGSDEIFKKL